MLAFPAMLVASARKAGMRTPDNPENFNGVDYPHFQVYCNVQLGSTMLRPDSH